MATKSPLSGLAIVVGKNEVVKIGDHILLTAEASGSGKIRLMIEAPKNIKILTNRYLNNPSRFK